MLKCGAEIQHRYSTGFLWYSKKQKSPKSGQLSGLNSRLNIEYALAVFIMRPQADVKSAPWRKNKQVAGCSQTKHQT
jgi:hypothetical protein